MTRRERPPLESLAAVGAWVVDEVTEVIQTVLDAVADLKENYMSGQAIIDSDVVQLKAMTADLLASHDRIEAEVTKLTATGVDTAALQAALADAQTASTGIAAISPVPATPPAPPAPPVAPPAP